ncbi:hypothetical protein SAMN05421788_102282 [Filimonas lacunae]|uniref:Uncharacterized protein n=1 Tax=Filimonas lacunae TaxID=477680 RepID=A0A173MHY8_9BACT|nr:hypothetical protein [Filimonas lacunae]BAV07087.1 hypothetical protein FLA_3107 [Filimonas lacunae]SIS95173.1 hypothetical protein SAMN05421788_102282 [Filimonas lacunae]
MSTAADTIRNLMTQLEQKAQSLDEKTRKRYRVNYVLGAASRIAGKPEVATDTEYITLLGNVVNTFPATPEGKKPYAQNINRYDAYIRKKYKLVPAGFNLAIWMSMGIGLGLPIGAALKNIALGIPIGIGLGLFIGSMLDNKAKKEDRVVPL